MAEAHVQNGSNLLLNALSGDHPSRFISSLELISLPARQMLYEPDVPIEHVYFPVNGVLSMLAQADGDIEIEVGTVGNEGMIGLPVFLGTDSIPGRAFAQVPGQAYKLASADFKEMIRDDPRVTSILHRYTQALMVQISQGTACNRIHSNTQRCARWLLQTHDRVGKDEFNLKQEFLAQMLGVRRATVGDIAGQLQKSGLIEYSRGLIRISDRARLEELSCSCYEVVRKEYDRMYLELR